MPGYEVIARKYRPTAFDEVVGQEAVAKTLKNAIRADRVAHAYMFCGPRGVGKTSTARILARALNCLSRDAPSADPCGTCDLCVRVTAGEDHDVLEIDAASNRKVDDARNLIANVSFHPSRTRFKVYIVDEVHMLTTEAFNALLKTLEEPPPHVKFIFATTDPQKVPATILSRCQRFDFRPVPPDGIARILRGICESEGLDADDEALLAIARAAVGGVRDAQSLLEQLATLGEGGIRVEDLHGLLGTVPGRRMETIFDALAAGDVGAVLDAAAAELDRGTDPGELLRQCMGHAHDLMTVRSRGRDARGLALDAAQRERLAVQAGSFSHATLVYAVSLFADTLQRMRRLGEGRILAETALARLAGHRELRYVDQLVRELRRLENTPEEARTVQLADELRGEPPQTTATSSGTAEPPEATPSAPRAGAAAPEPVARPAASRPVAPDETLAAPPAAPGAAPTEPVREPRPAEPARERSASPEAVGEAPVGRAEPSPAPPATDEPVATPAAAVPSSAPDDDADEPAGDQEDDPTEDASEAQDDGLSPWERVCETVRGNSRLRTALADAQVEDLEDGRLVLSFPPTAAWQVRTVAEGETHEALMAAVRQAYGAELELRIVDREDPEEEEEEDDGAGQGRRELYRRKLTRAQMKEARDAPLTKLVERLGGEVLRLDPDG